MKGGNKIALIVLAVVLLILLITFVFLNFGIYHKLEHVQNARFACSDKVVEDECSFFSERGSFSGVCTEMKNGYLVCRWK
jgi:hypothetical protein